MFGQIVRNNNKSCYDDLETCLKEVDEAVKNDHEMDVQPIHHDDQQQSTLMMASSEHRQQFEEWLMKFYFKEESKSRTAQIVTAKSYQEIFSLLVTPDTDLKRAERQKK